MRINGFAAAFDEVFAGIFGRLPRPRLFKAINGWGCSSPSVVVIGASTPAEAYDRWRRGWADIQALGRPTANVTQDGAA